jgi:ADP-ribose pyrophosphatase
MEKFKEQTIQSKKIYSGKIIDVQVDQVLLPDGNTASREIVKHPGAVAIIPFTNDGKIIFVKQYRKPLEKTIVEIPAGKIEPGEAKEVTAIRELEEETGYTTKKLNYITSFATSPGFADEIIHLYYTDALERLNHVVPGDDDEFVEVVPLTLQEAEQSMKVGEIADIKTAYALLYVKLLGLESTC